MIPYCWLTFGPWGRFVTHGGGDGGAQGEGGGVSVFCWANGTSETTVHTKGSIQPPTYLSLGCRVIGRRDWWAWYRCCTSKVGVTVGLCEHLPRRQSPFAWFAVAVWRSLGLVVVRWAVLASLLQKQSTNSDVAFGLCELFPGVKLQDLWLAKTLEWGSQFRISGSAVHDRADFMD